MAKTPNAGQAFDLGLLDLTLEDGALGVALWAEWIRFHTLQRGFSLKTIPPEALTNLQTATAGIDTDNNALVSVEKALKLAAAGDAARAGRMIRAFLVSGARGQANEAVLEEAVRVAIVSNDKALRGPRSGGKENAKRERDRLASRDPKIEGDCRRLTKEGHSAREIPGILAKRYALTPARIRAILKKAKLR